jgi:hypothetical protein
MWAMGWSMMAGRFLGVLLIASGLPAITDVACAQQGGAAKSPQGLKLSAEEVARFRAMPRD